MWIRALAIVVVLCGVVFADDQPPTTVGGQVTDVVGKPIAKARVYVLVGSQRVLAETDKDGRYAIQVPAGTHSVIIAFDKVHSYHQVLATEGKATVLDVQVEVDSSGGELIHIADKEPPLPHVPPKPTVDHRISLPYSDEAKARDAWARAWVLLDIDERGTVSRLKLVKPPGFGLDQIAVDKAFALTFEPALDAAGKPMRTYMLYKMEWPSWGWLVTGNGIASGKPNANDPIKARHSNPDSGSAAVRSGSHSTESVGGDGGPTDGERYARIGGTPDAGMFRPYLSGRLNPLSSVPCVGSGPLLLDSPNRAYRDCSPPPNATVVRAVQWITRENSKTVLAELARTTPKLVPRKRGKRILEWSVTGVTAGLVVAVGISFQRYTHWSTKAVEAGKFFRPLEELQHAERKLQTWETRALWTAGGALVGGAVTAFLWSRAQTLENFSVQPTQGGGAVSYGRSF